RTSWVMADSTGTDHASDTGVCADRGPGAGLALGVDRGGALCGRRLAVFHLGRVDVAPCARGDKTELDSHNRRSGLCHCWTVSGQLVETERLARPQALGQPEVCEKGDSRRLPLHIRLMHSNSD